MRQDNADLFEHAAGEDDDATELIDFLASQTTNQIIEEEVNSLAEQKHSAPTNEVNKAPESSLEPLEEEQLSLLDDVLPDDAFLSEDESDQHIRSHNDALDGPPSVGDELAQVDDAEAEVRETSHESPEDGDHQANDPFLGFASARALIGDNQGLDKALSGLRKPPSGLDKDQGNVQSRMEPVEMNAAGAAMMLGAMGLLKIGKLAALAGKGVGSGAGLIGKGLSNWQGNRAEKEMQSSLSVVAAGLDNLRHKGLGQLDDINLGVSERQEMAKQFFARPGNEVLLEQLFADANRLKHKARTLLEKSVKASDPVDAEALISRVLEPIRQFTDKNEQMMESLKVGEETLLDRMDNAMNSLFSLLREMLQKLADSLGLGKGEKPAASGVNSGPVMG
ncbi:hypothetical protein [Stutzerimonas stutzeri]|uniref:hypothetical protein n=1 Tax=Stutzerimonas stutzeri TaxID=316 RepID=UPI00265C9A9F|nr:hypothetical protein [Stutzerimonas stutzeri]MCF6783412.1 hypothetical protein [Stutzerimonas stutzeri]